MTITELKRYVLLDQLSPYYPFVYSSRPTYYQLASFWTSTFDVPDESIEIIILISAVTFLFNQKFGAVNSVANCISQERSFYFDEANQILYIHIDHDYSNYLEDDIYQYGRVFGFNDKKMTYLNDIAYLPYLRGVPSVAQQEDISSYKKLAGISGTISYDNVSNYFDVFRDENVYGNDIDVFYLDDDIENPSRSDMIPLCALFVQNYTFSLTEFKVKIQDKRKLYNTKIPVDLFRSEDYPYIDQNLVGKPIPLAYGSTRYMRAYPVDGEGVGDVTFRAARILTSLGTVQVKQGDSWVTVSPSSTDLSIGSFTLSYADCRDEGSDVGDVLDCRLRQTEGIANIHSSDIIKDLIDRELGIPYNASNYDMTEWEAEEAVLSEIGILFDKQIDLYEAVRRIQNGSNRGFRYEINNNGFFTIMINNFVRDESFHIYNVKIKNRDKMEITSDPTLLAGKVYVDYNKDYYDNVFLTYPYEEGERAVLEAYNQAPVINPETYLIAESDAIDRAGYDYSRFSKMPRTCKLSLIGSEYMPLRIYDVGTVELTPDFVDIETMEYSGREYFGVWVAQVIGINLKPGSKVNDVILLLIRKYIPGILAIPDQTKNSILAVPDQTKDSVLIVPYE